MIWLRAPKLQLDLFTAIDFDNPCSMPPLNKPLMFCSALNGNRGWHLLESDIDRIRVIKHYGYTFWRHEMTVDKP